MTETASEQDSALPEHPPQRPSATSSVFQRNALAILAGLLTCLYGVIALLSWRFRVDSVTTERPIIAVLLLFTVAFLVYLFSIRIAVRGPESRRSLMLIVWAAILFRVVMLFSVPIQEIDIYRYLWDGAVSSTGINPFRYSPEQVLAADANASSNEGLQRLVALLDREPALAEILRRVHFGELPTIYPSTSQAVFAAAHLTTPSGAPVLARVFIMKAWLIAFDIATLFVVIGLLKLCQKPAEWCVIYAWCPLLLKEVANSGHLDAVAVFLTTLTVYLVVRLMMRRKEILRTAFSTTMHLVLISLVLALAVGAKLYPIVLAPLVFSVVAKNIGLRYMVVPAGTFALASIVILWPILPHDTAAAPEPSQLEFSESPATPTVESPAMVANDPSRGVKTFLRRWEMNDFIFMVLIENLKPTVELSPDQVAWFSIVAESARRYVTGSVANWWHVDVKETPFLTSRAVTALVFILVAIWLARSAAGTRDPSRLCESAFLTLAWFWLLCPTQNPWYWTWALPLLPFARGRAWLLVSGLVMIYYMRFWFSYHYPESPVLGTRYTGPAFYDFIVTWIEFAPWFLFLAFDFIRREKPVNGN